MIDTDTGTVALQPPSGAHAEIVAVARGHAELYNFWDSYRAVKVWNDWIGPHFPAFRLEGGIHSVIDLATGSVVYRCDESSLWSTPAKLQWWHPEGLIVRGPPIVRWGWWTALQAFLAAPLLALWLIGVWRRRRKLLALP